MNLPITVSARSKAWTVFARSNAGIIGSNPTQGMDVCMCDYSVFVLSCVEVAAWRRADHLFGRPSIRPSLYLSVRPSVYPTIYVSISIPIHLSLSVSVCLSNLCFLLPTVQWNASYMRVYSMCRGWTTWLGPPPHLGASFQEGNVACHCTYHRNIRKYCYMTPWHSLSS
jgi:hypothetical protein